MQATTIFYWDFYGPDAEGTARHFLTHLHGYIAHHTLVGTAAGMDGGPGHWAVHCQTPDDVRELILRLRPRRAGPTAAG